MSSRLDGASIARLSLHDPSRFGIQHAQTLHRLKILEHWNIPVSSKILELGCGQGDCTAALAYVVGEEGTVTAVDPADLDYGSPYTLGQAQSHISHGPLGQRITWVQESPHDYLSRIPTSDSKTFDVAVFAHCLWYFASPSLILSTFRTIKQHSKRLLLAEWSLVASSPSAKPHILAVLAQAALECRKSNSTSNIRTILSPKRIIELALAAGWSLEREAYVQPEEGLRDGQWEVITCLAPSFGQQIEENVNDERERSVVFALRDACEASVKEVEGGQKGTRAMDVWVASFV